MTRPGGRGRGDGAAVWCRDPGRAAVSRHHGVRGTRLRRRGAGSAGQTSTKVLLWAVETIRLPAETRDTVYWKVWPWVYDPAAGVTV